ncbi:MAG: hypothetical protein Q8O88_00900 [bacterium]|nr:hypothetical protein [bacterium]
MKLSSYGSEAAKIVICTETTLPPSWFEYLNIPDKELLIVYFPKNLKTNDFVDRFRDTCSSQQFQKFEMIITVGAGIGKIFKPTLNMKKECGQIYVPDLLFKKYKICHLRAPGYYKAVKMADEFKQLQDLRIHFLSYYKWI